MFLLKDRTNITPVSYYVCGPWFIICTQNHSLISSQFIFTHHAQKVRNNNINLKVVLLVEGYICILFQYCWRSSITKRFVGRIRLLNCSFQFLPVSTGRKGRETRIAASCSTSLVLLIAVIFFELLIRIIRYVLVQCDLQSFL